MDALHTAERSWRITMLPVLSVPELLRGNRLRGTQTPRRRISTAAESDTSDRLTAEAYTRGHQQVNGGMNGSLDPHSSPAEAEHRNHLIDNLVVCSQLAIGSNPPEQLNQLARSVLSN
jgi:hypothetical protein